ncbi:hypothetical protein RH858_15365 [Halalkaliarchaeum sp. AArc-GB]|uniref:hypothetical protein n=1 Tax=Halalkaliarchaeum sp. AArc-GB TaxID=3074078 RepID=UPI002862360C|nr:hypothetical protein [Halalkaliarchaeum sp. AArc-GB]MDR5674505.1 hypothetical protein [Halalkaliarchaeum sp. AArc-GB]
MTAPGGDGTDSSGDRADDEAGDAADADADPDGWGPTRAWTRPGTTHVPGDDDGELPFDDLHFHRYCALYPFTPEDDVRVSDDSESEHDPEIRYLSGVARTGLRHTPMIVLAVTVLFFTSAELTDGVQGVSAFLPTLSTAELLIAAAAIGLWGVLIGLLVRVELLTVRELYKAGVVYGTLAFLAVGTAVSIWLVLFDHDGTYSRNIVFTSGYLLLLLLGGLLVYDGLRRTEHLFDRLGNTMVVGNKTAYEERKHELADRLSHAVSIPGTNLQIPSAYLFSVVFVSQIAVLWWLGLGPQNLDYPVTLVGNVLLNLFLVAVFFQFLVLIGWFYELVNDDRDGDREPALTYLPYHPDGHGGYRDLGKFATRVNLLLILAGFYLVYRLYVQGSRVSGAEMAPGFDPAFGSFLWFSSFVLPVILYAIAAGAWLYYSFWQLHLRMARERERYYAEQTGGSFGGDPSGWRVRSQAPVWPIDNGQLFSLVSGTFFPLVLWLFDVFF